jgi:serine/threonine-protein kinase
MQSERWNRIQEIFEAAVDQDVSLREKIVRDACGDDQKMFAEVMALLAADSEGHSLLDHESAIEALPEAASLVGEQLGPFLLTEEIASGGMGSVYLGVRADKQFEQRVAVKVIQPGLNTSVILRRFYQERQILARLQHPNIAQLIDGGLTPDRRPYFIMEYVDGEPIDQYCRKRSLSVVERLNIFLQACEAVEFAHSNLVVHRDIKPANILVGNDGRVKLLDFGIAKVTEGAEGLAEAPALTMTGFRALTPRYASPEQLRNETITTASDVYSLGVVLYELLTGHYPYLAKRDSAMEFERAVITQEPERPSSVILRTDDNSTRPGEKSSNKEDLRKLRRLLRGDLDTICITALRKDIERRYHTVRQLTDDIRRYLSGFPIEARMDSVPYMAGKFIRRHRTIVTIATLAVLAIAITTAVYTQRLARERNLARIEARKAEAISSFLTGIFEVSDPNVSQGKEISARELLDTAVARLNTQLNNQPAVKANLMSVTADIYFDLGVYPEARKLAFKAADLRRTALGENNADYAWSLEQLARILDDAGEPDSALTFARQQLSIVKKLYPEKDTMVATAQISMAYIYRHLGQFDSAAYYYTHALATQRELLGDADVEVGNTLNHLARLYFQQGEYAKAEPLAREAIQNLRTYYQRDDHFEVIAAMGNLGGILSAEEKYPQAESVFTQARNILARVVGTDHAYYGGITEQLANAVYHEGKIEEAHRLFDESLKISEKNLPYNHPGHVAALIGLGRLLSEHGDYREGEKLLREALQIRQNTLPADHWQIATTESLLADCLRRGKHFKEGARLAGHSFQVLYEKFGKDDPRTVLARKVLLSLYDDWGKPLPVDSEQPIP